MITQIPNRLLALYRSAPFAVRFHVTVRWNLFPFDLLVPYITPSGNLADIGCGYGLWSFYMAFLFPQSQVVGIDPDQKKIFAAGELALYNKVNNIQFHLAKAQDYIIPECAVISLIDVLYLIPFDEQERILNYAASKLQKNGRILLKEMSQRPKWKNTINRVEEWLAVRVFRLTYGNGFYFRQEEKWASLLSKAGLSVRTLRLDKGYFHPHVLLVGEKP